MGVWEYGRVGERRRNSHTPILPYYVSRFILVLKGAALLLLIAWLAAPPPILVTLGPQQVVSTSNSKIGIHTRLTDEVEEWKIKKTLELVREMGAPWIVEYFPWGYIENAEGEYDWAHSDLVVDHARRQGLTVIARLGFVPAWARPKDSVISYLDEARYPAFAQFVGEFIRHFKGRVKYVVIWNEPNLNFEWGYRPVDPEGYTRMLQAVYPVVQAADPETQILAGALAPTLAPPGLTDAMSDLDYLQKMYDAGAKDYFDILAIHSYGWQAAADEPPARARVNFRRTELLREIMIANGDGDKRAIITEGGWNDHPRWTKAVRPAERIADTVRAYEIVKQWDWVQACVLWAFRYPAPAQTYQDYFTFVTPDFDPKPIYYEVQRYAAR
ncbi:MAG: beta-galactosidase [Chloroflexi bacterium]|nr:beta-galactosidase [Chloroflexota bacterium]